MTLRISTLIVIALTSLAAASAPETPELLKLAGAVSGVHDPVIIREGEWYYVFATGGSIRRSKDMHEWALCGRVFEKSPDWHTQEIPGARGGYWAPDVSYHSGTYRLYYSVSTFGRNDSAIGLATNETLDPASPKYKWVDQGPVFRSYSKDDFNAIDPNLAVDERGHHWLNFGSFWGGIKMRRIDPDSGKLSSEDATLYSLASRPRGPRPEAPDAPPQEPAIEAPFIIRHGEYYYLFVSFDFCCRGARSTYNIVVGRSAKITGPYVDRTGKPMLDGGGTRLIQGTSLWRGPGHQGLLMEPRGDIMVFHAYDGVTGRSSLQISTVVWEDGWPRIAILPGDQP
jgi:arabinan endo-1,5-alpha-L-arabinosidase